MSKLSEPYIALSFIQKPTGNCESPEPEGYFRPAYPTDASKSDGAPHITGSWQYKFDFNFDPQGRTVSGENKHSPLTYVHAVPGVDMVLAVGPAEQGWQRYLKPPRIPSLNRLAHIRHSFLAIERAVPGT